MKKMYVPIKFIGDVNPALLAHAHAVGFETIDLSQDVSLADQLGQILDTSEVDYAADCVGIEA